MRKLRMVSNAVYVDDLRSPPWRFERGRSKILGMTALRNLDIHDESLTDFCQRWKITELALFGSALRSDFGPGSDIDLLVSFRPDAEWSLLDHLAMQEELSLLLGREVDLVTRRSVERSRNWIRRDEILSDAETIFAA